MLLYKKLYCICWEQHCSDGIWRFWRADDQLSVLPRDAFMLLNRIDSIPASEKAGTLYLRIYPYVDPDKITTMFLFATSPLLSQSGNTKSSIKGNTLKEPLNKPRPRTTDLFRQSYGSKNGKYVAAVGDKGAIRMRACPLRVRKVFRHFPNLVLTKNLSPSTAADLIRASLA